MSQHLSGNELRAPGRFELRHRLGQGASGTVFEAFDRERSEVVAIKTVRANDVTNIALLKNEFRAVQDLLHPNLVRLGELFESDGQWFFTMELVPGVSFLDYVRPRQGAFDEARLRDALVQLARGLGALHSAQIIHRDVKPSNVLVTAEGRVVLLDFGIAQELGGRRRAFGDEGEIVGTVTYMAPEQVAGESSAAADWYAVGVMLYEALTGDVPFAGSMAAVLAAKTTDEAPAPRAEGVHLPSDLATLCSDLLRLDSAVRPTGARVLERLGARDEGRGASSSGRIAVFVGRRKEMEALDGAFVEVAGGEAASVVVEGESGVGKSYLVRHFLGRIAAAHPSALLLEARCYERESVPYKAVDGVVDDLRVVLERMDEAERREILPPGARGLVQLFPILAEVCASSAAATHEEIKNPTELRLRVFALLRELLGRLARRAPLLITIDDFQWADADGLALLAEVMRPPDAPPLLLVATVRTSTEVGRGAGEVSLPGAVRYVRVQKLPAGDAEELVHKLLGEEDSRVARAEVSAIIEDAGGHPLFLDELVRRRALGGGAGERVRLDDALWARIERLDADTRRLVELASVAGVPVTPRVAVGAAALSPGELFRALSTGRSARFLRTTGIGEETAVDVYHDRVRASVLARLEPST
ncbi:MAG TPA: protein kinase, partial [Polyangiaceae bacterium]